MSALDEKKSHTKKDMPFQKPEVGVIENDPFRILTVNSGSSSIKFSLYEMGPRELRRLSGQAERIGESEGLSEDCGGRIQTDGQDVSSGGIEVILDVSVMIREEHL